MPTIATLEAPSAQRTVRSPSRRNGDRAAALLLQPGSRERATTLERSTSHNTISVLRNSRGPAPQYFAAPLSPPPMAPLPKFPMPTPSTAAANASQNEDFLWTISRAGEAETVIPPFAEQPSSAPQPPKQRPHTPGEDFRASPVMMPLRRRLSDRQRSTISAPAPSPRGASILQLPPPQQQQPTSPLDPHLITAQRYIPTTILQSSSPLFAGVAASAHDRSTSPAARSQISVHGGLSSLKASSVRVPIFRSNRAPPTFNRRASTAFRSTASSSASSSSRRTDRSKSTRKSAAARRSLDAHPAAVSRLKATSSIRSALSVIDDFSRLKTRSDAIAKPSAKSSSPGGIVRSPFKRSQKGETMSMLVDTGFFPVEELIYGKEVSTVSRLRQSQMYRINLPPRLSFLGDHELSTGLRSPTGVGGGGETPTDSLSSPKSPTSPRRSYRKARNRRSGRVRSPLTQISENLVASTVDEQDEEEEEEEEEGGGGGGGEEEESHSLAAIAEGPWDDEENVPPEIGSAMPAARDIHLRGGSVVTLTPPELTAWRCATYIHGAIKLPKAAIVPRKNSVASLDPFQHVVDDDMYHQRSLVVPRRRSDDAVVDDICDFFDEFGWDVMSIVYAGDGFGVAHTSVDEAREMEMQTRQAVLRLQATRRPPPVETEETLRARGKARLSRGSAASVISSSSSGSPSPRASFTPGRRAGRSGSVLLLLPAPEGSLLQASRAHSPSAAATVIESQDGPGSRGGAGTAAAAAASGPATATATATATTEDVQEISTSSAWVAPGIVSHSQVPSKASSSSPSSRQTRNPLSRFRKAKAAASASSESRSPLGGLGFIK